MEFKRHGKIDLFIWRFLLRAANVVRRLGYSVILSERPPRPKRHKDWPLEHEDKIWNWNLSYIQQLEHRNYDFRMTTFSRRYGSHLLYIYMGPKNGKVVFEDKPVDDGSEQRCFPFAEVEEDKQMRFTYIDEEGRLCDHTYWPLLDENTEFIYADKEDYYSLYPWMREEA